ncbi:MAG TPA: hypothetical protein VFV78_10905 [Vicinamibacterales bacterium]|nr:hypothetical protein [Vicinamibacterales bacterium]
MRRRVVPVVASAIGFGVLAFAQSASTLHLNPVIDLLLSHKPVFGLTAPVSPRNGPARTATDLAKETVARDRSDFLFSGGMVGDFDRNLSTFAGFVAALHDAGTRADASPRPLRPIIVRTPRIGLDRAKAIDHISRQLNLGVSGIMIAGATSAEEVRLGLAAMRFKSQGGMRPDAIGTAPKYWGVTDAEYRRKADVWPLNRAGELISWVSIDNKDALAHLRDIAAVKGIGVLSPGAELRGVFTTIEHGDRVFDLDAWASAVNAVLAACQEFHVPCGYQATAADIAARMQQGFGVFLMNWSDLGFQAVGIGRRLAGR